MSGIINAKLFQTYNLYTYASTVKIFNEDSFDISEESMRILIISTKAKTKKTTTEMSCF